MTESRCPQCGEEPTDESVVHKNLSDIGYLHEDRRYECSSCGNRWTVGEPKGEPEDDTWLCDSCGGDLIPHFVYIYHDNTKARIKPKCQDCNWVPDDPLVIEGSSNGHSTRVFIGHHTVTGDRDAAVDNSF